MTFIFLNMFFLKCNLKLYNSSSFFSYLLFFGVFYLALLLKKIKKSQCDFFDFFDFLKKYFDFFLCLHYLFFLAFLSLIFINRHALIKKPVKIVDYCDFPLQNVNRFK